ncbi:regulatory protein [Weissella uvarum]|uniref:RecX family transcriptional regulator n=1 Tax=Weissella uvarum TaxID=1479233 RepID=UPI001960CD1C|nr:RecX family transcriptional regulator [Weissella uvarum]MBM7616514.1 regulatory protein [Weissella uvarum]MCM0595025.1 RecX family transcriptional regulator [Weissella uvarum]
MKVTKVTQQRRPGRYNIYFDDEFGIAVDEKVLIDFNLFKGTEIDEEQLDEVKTAEYEQKAYSAGLLYATGQLHSRYQVYLNLRDKDFPQDTINRVLDRLEAANVINDATFAQTYAQNMADSGKFGRKGTAEKLKSWGVKANLVEDALDVYPYEREVDHLAVEVPKIMAKNQRGSHQMAEQKVMQKLLQKGFSATNIKRALADYDESIENDQDEEFENLRRDGQKAFERYHQYSGWDQTQRVKSYLARRGYRFDDINHFVSDYLENN